ncbi:MAG TPA: type II secretion system protein [Patescibacteria group bacterium]|nr:type II secretion system protein [Patescibacteria group bacterium]
MRQASFETSHWAKASPKSLSDASCLSLLNSDRAFTVIELLSVLAVLVFVSALVLPAFARTKAASQRIGCSDNLRRIGVAFNTWGSSHSDAFPMSVPVTSGGYADFVGVRTLSPAQDISRGVFGNFLVMSNELNTPRVLICPAENEGRRRAATTFSGFVDPGTTEMAFTNDLNTSYFIGIDAVETGALMLLSGDHNIGSDGNLIPISGFVIPPATYRPSFSVTLGTNFAINAGPGWLDTMHTKQGNVVMGDGSVQQLNRPHLQETLRKAPVAVWGTLSGFRLAPGCIGDRANRIQFP